MVLGYLGPDDVGGKIPTQDGRLVNVTGKGGDVKINDTAKVLCSYTAQGRLHLHDRHRADAAVAAASTSTTASTSSAGTDDVDLGGAEHLGLRAPATGWAAPTTTKAPNALYLVTRLVTVG